MTGFEPKLSVNIEVCKKKKNIKYFSNHKKKPENVDSQALPFL